MKITSIKNIIFTTCLLALFSAISPSIINATSKLTDTPTNYIKKQENGKYCIDLEQAYKNTNEEGKALTGKETGIDNNKKSNTLAVLLNIYTFLAGNDTLCVKNNELAKQMKLSKTDGIIGILDETNTSMIAYFPTVNVVDHLAQTFLPGYERNNSTLAAESTSIIQNCRVTEEF